MKQWLYAHPRFQGNQLYIGGDSYSGLIVPILLKNILSSKSKPSFDSPIFAARNTMKSCQTRPGQSPEAPLDLLLKRKTLASDWMPSSRLLRRKGL
ncbi:putative peptidase S10, serine carboxypeptidase, alpha/Beta hydrolase [Rosa chinensis]|uniref:Putative peptidase S10, serine carboxypeptidase, alpha/Beta hydrolase n=1 Tax=Rosa chinensis TaxID=74649 RepID=A0A2P6QDA5_ROSCH|nr:putative peptidase S10, serine carboxypeptidase, alpha/Beta hydrolase [Rosa chinensis]